MWLSLLMKIVSSCVSLRTSAGASYVHCCGWLSHSLWRVHFNQIGRDSVVIRFVADLTAAPLVYNARSQYDKLMRKITLMHISEYFTIIISLLFIQMQKRRQCVIIRCFSVRSFNALQ